MIYLNLKGRLGNQLFQYSYAYVLSKTFDKKIYLIPCSVFGFWLNIFELKSIGNCCFIPFSITNTLRKIIKPKAKIISNSCFDNNIIRNDLLFPLEIDGFFQDGIFFSSFKSELFDELKIKEKYIKRFNKKFPWVKDSKILTINLRMKEYKTVVFPEINSTAFLPLEWLNRVFEKLDFESFDKIVVISDDISEAQTFLKDRNLNFTFINNDYVDDFIFLMKSNTVIIPNSSFSWWGAFLNRDVQKKVYAPYNWVGFNVGVEYPKGIMIEDFIWVK